jgi:hypothetical protein
MRKLTALALLLMLAPCVAGQSAPGRRRAAPHRPAAGVEGAAERIIEKFVEAQGDPQAIRAVRSYVMHGVVDVPELGLHGKVEEYMKRPGKRLMVVSLPGSRGQFLEGRDGRGGWAQTPFGGALDLDKEGAGAVGEGGGHGRSIRDMFSRLAFKGRATVAGREANVVEGTPVGGRPEVMYFDAQTGLLVRLDFLQREQGQRNLPKSVLFEGFARVEGVVLPTVLHQNYDDFTVTIRFYEVKFNVHIEDSLFERPKGASADGDSDN